MEQVLQLQTLNQGIIEPKKLSSAHVTLHNESFEKK
jgi:hypothetical protein